MKSWCVVGPGEPLEQLERPSAPPQGTEVQLAVSHCGVCHSDVHFWEGFMDVGAPEKVPVTAMGMTMPLTLGHEIVGRV
ncbi:MAG: alcohol dehydrogenase catalytic domain-containing protein, partial [Janthinobacterium lividum]